MSVGWNPSIHVYMLHVQNLLVFLDELYVSHLLYHLQEEIFFLILLKSRKSLMKDTFL